MAGSGTLTQPQWAIAFIRALGNLSPSQLTVDFVTGWGIHEGGGGSLVEGSTDRCNGNMLATCQKMPGSVHCASSASYVCVQSYLSNNDGIFANATALKNVVAYPQYGPLLRALQTNDNTSLGMVSGHQMTPEIVTALSTWVNGPGGNQHDVQYANGVLSAAKGQGGVNPQGGNVGGSTPTSRGIPVAGTTTAGTQGANATNNANPILAWFLGTPTAAWITNPMRVIKLILGILCLGIALLMLVFPDVEQAAEKLAPLVAA